MNWEQYEVWVLNDGRWEMAAWFNDFEVASAMASARNTRVRLIRATYEDGKKTASETIAEIGATRG